MTRGLTTIPCANCGDPIPAHPWAAYCTLACLIEAEWAPRFASHWSLIEDWVLLEPWFCCKAGYDGPHSDGCWAIGHWPRERVSLLTPPPAPTP